METPSRHVLVRASLVGAPLSGEPLSSLRRCGMRCVLLAAVVMACSSRPPTPPPTPTLTPGGEPDRYACTADVDCTYGQTFDDSGCCGTFADMAAAPQSHAYLDFKTQWRAANCADHACPSPPVPAEPPPCLFTVRCAASRCTNACQ